MVPSELWRLEEYLRLGHRANLIKIIFYVKKQKFKQNVEHQANRVGWANATVGSYRQSPKGGEEAFFPKHYTMSHLPLRLIPKIESSKALKVDRRRGNGLTLRVNLLSRASNFPVKVEADNPVLNWMGSSRDAKAGSRCTFSCFLLIGNCNTWYDFIPNAGGSNSVEKRDLSDPPDPITICPKIYLE